VAGLHYEGPHISKARKGTHKESLIRPIDERSFVLFERLRERGLTLMVTLAPECNPPGTISRLVKMGVVVSIGHSAADAAGVHAALAEGATAFTHLHNAMTPMTSREPGVVGAALDSDAYCGFIADCRHVAAETLRVSIRARKSPGRMIVVSDAMPTVGGPDAFQL
jgi:N-acetylglucosamine-6-phosphate deacetylase